MVVSALRCFAPRFGDYVGTRAWFRVGNSVVTTRLPDDAGSDDEPEEQAQSGGQGTSCESNIRLGVEIKERPRTCQSLPQRFDVAEGAQTA